MWVRLEPAALRSQVKHSSTEPLRSLNHGFTFYNTYISVDLANYEIVRAKGWLEYFMHISTMAYMYIIQYSCMEIRYAKLFEAAKSMFKSLDSRAV